MLEGARAPGFKQGVFLRDMGVVNLPTGQPVMQLTGGAAARLRQIIPANHEAQILVTITDDYPLAQAFVIISAVPAGGEPALDAVTPR